VIGAPMARPIERVVVPLDAASESQTAIETAARLAARTKAPLHGIFVEDEDLLYLAQLPFARQVTPGAGAAPFTPELAELHLRAAAERARRDLIAAAKRHGVKCTFEIVRGSSETALSGASQQDLIVAGALSRPIAGNFRLECRWWSSIEVASGPFLLARRDWSKAGPVVVLLRDCGPASARLLDAAAQVAEARDGLLTLVCPPAIVDAKEFENWLSDRLQGRSVRLQIEVAPTDFAALRQRIGELDCRLLAVEAGLVEGRADRVRELVERFACDVLIVG
jgi:nucleotide-binding universal stress UspA family protein